MFSQVHKGSTISCITHYFEEAFLKLIFRLVSFEVSEIFHPWPLIKFNNTMNLSEFESRINCLFEIHFMHNIARLVSQTRYQFTGGVTGESMLFSDVFSVR